MRFLRRGALTALAVYAVAFVAGLVWWGRGDLDTSNEDDGETLAFATVLGGRGGKIAGEAEAPDACDAGGFLAARSATDGRGDLW